MKRSGYQFLRLAGICGAAVMVCACATVVVTQSIPVSTNPSGAQVMADGKKVCSTPCSVDLGRNQDHLLTFQKEGYRQQDVAVQRHHQTEMSLLKAINSGVNSGTFFNNTGMGLNSAVQNLAMQQETGEAYTLVPSTVALTLVPDGGFPQRATAQDAADSLSQAHSPLKLMDNADEHMLETALESSQTGRPTVWANAATGIGFAVEPQDAETISGTITRAFKIGARKGDTRMTGFYAAYRVGRGEWIVGRPPAQPQPQPAASDASGWDSKGVVRALAESPWPSVQKDWTTSQSSSTTTTQGADGSVTTDTSSSSTKVGVSISPAGVMGVLDALEGLAGKENAGKDK